MSRLILAAALAVAAMVPLSTGSANAVSKKTAQSTCIKAAAAQHGVLMGNVDVRGSKKRGSGYEVNLVINGAEINCMLTGSGKVRYVN